MLELAFKVAADKPSTRKITLVQQVGYPDNVIDFGGPIVAGGENLQMGEGDTLKLELYEDGQPVAVLDQLEAIVSIPTAISFANRANTSRRPDGDWWGKQVLLTATIGGEEVRHWVRFYDHDPTPVVNSVSADAEGATPGRIVKNEDIMISGRNFGYDGTDVSLKFTREDGTEVWGVVHEMTDWYIKAEWPDGLDDVADGAEVAVRVTRNIGGESKTSSPVTVTVVTA